MSCLSEWLQYIYIYITCNLTSILILSVLWMSLPLAYYIQILAPSHRAQVLLIEGLLSAPRAQFSRLMSALLNCFCLLEYTMPVPFCWVQELIFKTTVHLTI